ncbi:MAG: hypothetical protein ACYC4K_09000 [Thiobacillus sp.]
MADEADRAEAAEEKFREYSLKHREPELIPVGACYWCDSILGSGKTFCDKDCRDDYQAARDAQTRNGY